MIRIIEKINGKPNPAFIALSPTEAVQLAEETKEEADFEAAQVLVDFLEEGQLKNALQSRLENLAAYFEANEAVKKAVASEEQEDLFKAFELVNLLKEELGRAELLEPLYVLQNKLSAIHFLDDAEKTFIEMSFKIAQESIEALPEGEVREALESRLEELLKQKEQLEEVANQINDLDRYSENFIEEVEVARKAYDTLNENQQRLVIIFTTHGGMYTNQIEDLEKLIELGSVSTSEEFKTAVGNENLDFIFLSDSFELPEYIKIDRRVTINGGGHKLTLTNPETLWDGTSNSAIIVLADLVDIRNLTVDVPKVKNGSPVTPMHIGLEVKGAEHVNLQNMTFMNGHTGLYINAKDKYARVETSHITTLNNSLGGIGIHVGESNAAMFTTNGEGNMHTHPAGVPAIWKEGKGYLQIIAPDYTKQKNPNNIEQDYYYKK